jgi:ribA/ribD-fused uncharacterized protein
MFIKSFTGKYSFLSNFYPSEIEYQGIKYPTVEHYYVAMKIDNDQKINGKKYNLLDARKYISSIKSPGEVKKLGKKLKIRKDWNDIKLSIMYWGIKEKFKNEELKNKLLDTGDMEIVEYNNWGDQFWGVCNNEGQNKLGKILMNIRDELK